MKNTKIAFYLDMPNLERLDFFDYLKGNPGMGGAEYEFLLVAQMLYQRGKFDDCILLTRSQLPGYIHSFYVESFENACLYCEQHHVDVFIINQGQYEKIPPAYKDRLSLVLWAHNIVESGRLKNMCRDKSVKRVVFCGREFMELYYDNLVMRKSSCINNIIPIQEKQWYRDKIVDGDNHNVVFMGAIIPAKGFHLLAKAWPEVVR